MSLLPIESLPETYSKFASKSRPLFMPQKEAVLSFNKVDFQGLTTPGKSNIAMENTPFIDAFPIRKVRGFPANIS